MSPTENKSDALKIATEAALSASEPLPPGTEVVKGYDFSDGAVDYEKLLSTYINSGFQATNLGRAVEIVNKMVCLPSFLSSCIWYHHN